MGDLPAARVTPSRPFTVGGNGVPPGGQKFSGLAAGAAAEFLPAVRNFQVFQQAVPAIG
jgi:hypothetical protein